MKPIEDYDMTEEEIDRYTDIALIDFLMDGNTSKSPEVTFVVGQPGAGKTLLAAFATREIQSRDSNENLPINLNADKVATYHKYYKELLKYAPEERYNASRKFVNPAIKEIQEKLIDKDISMVMECTLNSNKKLALMDRIRKRGYKSNVKVMVVNEFESRMSTMEREAQMLKYGEKPRGIDKKTHDEPYYAMLGNLSAIMEKSCWDSVSLYRRGPNNSDPEDFFSANNNTTGYELVSKIKAERQRQMEELRKKPEEYYSRVQNVREIFEKLYMSNTSKEDAIARLNELEKDYTEFLTKRNLEDETDKDLEEK